MSTSTSSNTEANYWTSSPAHTDASSTTPPSTPTRPAYTVVNNIATLKRFIDAIVQHVDIPKKLYSKADSLPNTTSPNTSASNPTQPRGLTPELYVDAEGISLSRSGELSILIVHVETRTLCHTYLLHIHVLRRRAFYTKSSDGVDSLQTIFMDNRIPKVLFDCRMDSDAMFGQYGVLLQGVIDLQLMCLASKGGGGPGLPGLETCLLWDLDIDTEEREWVRAAKALGKKLWHPSSGGSMQRFNDSPLDEGIIDYCVVDAAYLPRLFEKYNNDLGNRVFLNAVVALWGEEWECRILNLSKIRAERCVDPDFRGGTGSNPWFQHKNYIDDDDDDWDY